MDDTTLNEPAENEEDLQLTDPWYLPPFTPTVELADGTTMNGSAMINRDSDDLWIWLEAPVDLNSAFITFSDPGKTKTITSHTSSIETFTWENYTELSLIQSTNTQITIRMRKERI